MLHTIENKAGNAVISSFTYSVNAIGQRESVATTGSAFASVPADWTWRYDSLGQVVAADHANTSAADRAYEFDTIGNRKKTSTGTLSLPTSDNWTSNALNQYTIANGVSLPTTPAPAPYDADGNMTAGPVPGANGNLPGVQAPAAATDITWDGENRLISLKISGVTYSYTYDHLSRLVTNYNGDVSIHYCYDGWNRIAEYIGTNVDDTFTWGLDLSGTMQGAGGVGGLLATRWVSSGNTDYFPTYDGNGNVSEYLGTSGTNVAHYEYDPFGTLTTRTGSDSVRFQYRFSTKPRDPNSGLYYYGYRWYDPITGRWPSRDPIGERGESNLYGYAGFKDHKKAQLFTPETIVDIGHIIFDVGYIIAGLVDGTEEGDQIVKDGVGDLVNDVGAALIPGVPGGANKARRIARDQNVKPQVPNPQPRKISPNPPKPPNLPPAPNRNPRSNTSTRNRCCTLIPAPPRGGNRFHNRYAQSLGLTEVKVEIHDRPPCPPFLGGRKNKQFDGLKGFPPVMIDVKTQNGGLRYLDKFAETLHSKAVADYCGFGFIIAMESAPDAAIWKNQFPNINVLHVPFGGRIP